MAPAPFFFFYCGYSQGRPSLRNDPVSKGCLIKGDNYRCVQPLFFFFFWRLLPDWLYCKVFGRDRAATICHQRRVGCQVPQDESPLFRCL